VLGALVAHGGGERRLAMQTARAYGFAAQCG
jgi:hypothetical protein